MPATSDTTGFSYSTPAGPDTADLTGATSSNSQGSLFSATSSGLQTLDAVITTILSDNKKIAFEPYNNQFTLSDGTTGYSALHYATLVKVTGLNYLDDVNISNIADNQLLSYDSSTSKFINAKLAFDNIASGVVLDSDTMSGTSATTLATSESIKAYVDAQVDTHDQLSELTDVNITSAADGAMLLYDTGTSKWIDNVMSGDATMLDTGVITLADGNSTRTNLGLAIGSDVQAYDAGLTSISGLTTAADKMIYTTGSDTYAVTTLTSAGRAILDDADAAAQRTTLGLGTTAVTGVDNSTIEIDSSNLRVKADGINDTHIDFGTGTNQVSSADVPEQTNLYYTDARARASVSATDGGGDGSFAYNSSTGVFTYTGPSASEVRAHLSAGTGLTYSSGAFAIDGSVVTESSTDTLTNKTLTSPVLNGSISGTSIKDEDNMSSNSATHLATQQSIKAYVDSVAEGLDVKNSVRVTTTANITLANTQTIDGVSLSAGDRVLVKDQSTGSQNGVYVVVNGGSWTRATDFDSNTEVTDGTFFFVEQGTLYADSGWVLTTNNPITVGSTALVFSQFSGAGQITAGTGLSKSGNTINADDATTSAKGIASFNTNHFTVSSGAVSVKTLNQSTTGNAATATALASSVDINGTSFNGSADITVTAAAGTLTGNTLASGVTGSSLTSVGTIATGVWNGTDIAIAHGGTGSSTASGARTNLGLGTAAVLNSVDEDDMNSNSATLLPTQQSVKAYVDANAPTGAQTGMTSILNTNLVIGHDADNDIDFATDNQITFRVNGEDQIKLTDGALVPLTDNDIDLGVSGGPEFKDLYLDGTAYVDAISAGGGLTFETGIHGINIGSSGNNDVTLIRAGNNATNYGFNIKYLGSGGGVNNSLAIFTDNEQGGLASLQALTIRQDGHLGILNTNPTYELSVTGDIQASDDIVVGDDLFMSSDGSVINFGGNNEVNLTHVHDTGLLLNGEMQLQFGDGGTYIHQSANGVLDLVADVELELNGAIVDINSTAGNVDIATTGGNVTLTGDVGDMTFTNSGTGDISLGNFKFDSDQTVGSSQDNYVLTYDHSSTKISLEAASGGGSAAAGSLTGNTLASGVTASSLTSVGTLTGLTVSGDVTFSGDNYNMVWDKSDNALEFADNAIFKMGTGGDLKLYHNGTHSVVTNVSGNDLYFIQGVTDKDMIFMNDSGSGGTEVNYMVLDGGEGEVQLYHAGSGSSSVKLATKSTGVDVTGTLTTDGLTSNTSGADANSVSDLTGDFGTWIRVGDGVGSKTMSNGFGIKFHDAGNIHWSVGGISGGSFRISKTSADGDELFPSSKTDAIIIGTDGGVVLPINATLLGNVNIGSYSDTTLSRVSAGVLAVEGKNLSTVDDATALAIALG